jgi:hypothetical protein
VGRGVRARSQTGSLGRRPDLAVVLVAGAPWSSAGAETAESDVERRRILRRFHPDVPFLRIHNLGQKAAETRSNQAPTSDHSQLLFDGICRASGSIISLNRRPRLKASLTLLHPVRLSSIRRRRRERIRSIGVAIPSSSCGLSGH